MNVNSKRNTDKEEHFNAFRFYDIYNIEKGQTPDRGTYIGSIAMKNPDDTRWCIIKPGDSENNDAVQLQLRKKPLGNFVQCVAELKIQAELATS